MGVKLDSYSYSGESHGKETSKCHGSYYFLDELCTGYVVFHHCTSEMESHVENKMEDGMDTGSHSGVSYRDYAM